MHTNILKPITALGLTLGLLVPGLGVQAAEPAAAEKQILVSTHMEYERIPWEGRTDGPAPLSTPGRLPLKPGCHERWIDRLDLSDSPLGEEATRNIYAMLEEAADNDGVSDFLIEDQYYQPGTELSPEALETLQPGEVVTLQGATMVFLGKEEMTYDQFLSNQQNGFPAYDYITGAYAAFLRDHPEVFWLRSQWQYYTTRYDTNQDFPAYYFLQLNWKVNVKYPDGSILQETWQLRDHDRADPNGENYESQEEIRTRINAMDRAAYTILGTPEFTAADREGKIRYLNNWLTRHNGYNTVTTGYRWSHQVLSGLLDRQTLQPVGSYGSNGPVCEGYAKALKVLCDRAGIPCVLVDGTALSGSLSEAHMWNYVRMEDGGWYAVDVTWNDPGRSSMPVSGMEHENYLLVGANTVVEGRNFLESHPVSNSGASNGLTFPNGPQLEEERYVARNFVEFTCAPENGQLLITAACHGSRPAEQAVIVLAGYDADGRMTGQQVLTWADTAVPFRQSAAQPAGVTWRVFLLSDGGTPLHEPI